MSQAGQVARAPNALVPSGVLGMAMFLAAETMFFAGLISAFAVLRAQAPLWPPVDQPRLPVGVTGFNTLLLLASAWTMQRACAALPRERAVLTRWLGVTAGLGGLFLLIQGVEWTRMIQFGLSTTSSLYGATFYVLVGAHGLHVLAAVVALFWVRSRTARHCTAETAEAHLRPMRMYWFFVVAIWPLLYGLVYF
jgi:heme/copper-type cytochrome/quinol oxidase subunit 3